MLRDDEDAVNVSAQAVKRFAEIIATQDTFDKKVAHANTLINSDQKKQQSILETLSKKSPIVVAKFLALIQQVDIQKIVNFQDNTELNQDQVGVKLEAVYEQTPDSENVGKITSYQLIVKINNLTKVYPVTHQMGMSSLVQALGLNGHGKVPEGSTDNGAARNMAVQDVATFIKNNQNIPNPSSLINILSQQLLETVNITKDDIETVLDGIISELDTLDTEDNYFQALFEARQDDDLQKALPDAFQRANRILDLISSLKKNMPEDSSLQVKLNAVELKLQAYMFAMEAASLMKATEGVNIANRQRFTLSVFYNTYNKFITAKNGSLGDQDKAQLKAFAFYLQAKFQVFAKKNHELEINEKLLISDTKLEKLVKKFKELNTKFQGKISPAATQAAETATQNAIQDANDEAKESIQNQKNIFLSKLYETDGLARIFH